MSITRSFRRAIGSVVRSAQRSGAGGVVLPSPVGAAAPAAWPLVPGLPAGVLAVGAGAPGVGVVLGGGAGVPALGLVVAGVGSYGGGVAGAGVVSVESWGVTGVLVVEVIVVIALDVVLGVEVDASVGRIVVSVVVCMRPGFGVAAGGVTAAVLAAGLAGAVVAATGAGAVLAGCFLVTVDAVFDFGAAFGLRTGLTGIGAGSTISRALGTTATGTAAWCAWCVAARSTSTPAAVTMAAAASPAAALVAAAPMLAEITPPAVLPASTPVPAAPEPAAAAPAVAVAPEPAAVAPEPAPAEWPRWAMAIFLKKISGPIGSSAASALLVWRSWARKVE